MFFSREGAIDRLVGIYKRVLPRCGVRAMDILADCHHYVHCCRWRSFLSSLTQWARVQARHLASKHANMQANKQASKHANKHASKHANKHANRHASKQACKHASIQACKLVSIHAIWMWELLVQQTGKNLIPGQSLPLWWSTSLMCLQCTCAS